MDEKRSRGEPFHKRASNFAMIFGLVLRVIQCTQVNDPDFIRDAVDYEHPETLSVLLEDPRVSDTAISQ
jgi:hypothetical protein